MIWRTRVPETLPVFALVWLALNVFAFALFAWDKHLAQQHHPRIPEKRLLEACLLGGVGAMWACELFRHKTRKQPFRRYAVLLSVLHALITAALVWALFEIR